MERAFRYFQTFVVWMVFISLVSCRGPSGGSENAVIETESAGFLAPDGWAFSG